MIMELTSGQETNTIMLYQLGFCGISIRNKKIRLINKNLRYRKRVKREYHIFLFYLRYFIILVKIINFV
jgi:hypothetical protein